MTSVLTGVHAHNNLPASAGKSLNPYIFIYDPALLMQGSWSKILLRFSSAIIGVVTLAGSFQGWLFTTLGFFLRIGLFASAAFLIMPGLTSNLIGLFLSLTFSAVAYAKRPRKALEQLAET